MSFDRIVDQIREISQPSKVVLFGSQAKGTSTDKSDVDICVVADTENKRKVLTDIYYHVDYEKPIDFLLYTTEEWAECVIDPQSFAYNIDREGVILYGRQQEV